MRCSLPARRQSKRNAADDEWWRRGRVSGSPSDDAVSISYDSGEETYRARFDDDAIAPSMAIIEAMASVCDTSPTELEPLVDTVDPMAIDRLMRGADGTDDRVLEFRYVEHVVTVHGRGIVEIRPPAVDADD
jgi:hypothetical protein